MLIFTVRSFVPSNKAVLSQGGVDCSRVMCYQAKLTLCYVYPEQLTAEMLPTHPLQGLVICKALTSTGCDFALLHHTFFR